MSEPMIEPRSEPGSERLNWSGSHAIAGRELVAARSIDDVCRAVADAAADGSRVRALGTRHSFNDLPDTTGTLVDATSIPADVVLDESARTVTVGGGTRYGEVAAWLEARGWALHNLGSLPHISVAGATATGTHGSGIGNGSLSTAVRGLEIVGPDGDVRIVRAGDPELAGSIVALGALGVVVRVTLAIEPTYLVRQDSYRDLTWGLLLDDLYGVMGAGYSVSVFTDWTSPTIEQVWVKRRTGGGTDTQGEALDLLGTPASGIERPLVVPSDEVNTTIHLTPGPWNDRLPHFRFDATPSVGDELQTEYFVGREDAADALRAVRTVASEFVGLLVITELRTIAADDLWLSPAYGRESFAFHFTWVNDEAAVRAVLPTIERALAPFEARPHWGKVNGLTVAELAPLYPRFDDARELFAHRDPSRTFWNEAMSRLLG
jgi:xylitol oxidase